MNMGSGNSLRINPNAALEDASSIDTIVENIDKEVDLYHSKYTEE